MSEWGDMSIHGLLFQWASTIKIQLSMLVYYKADLIISLKINLFSPSYSWKIAELALNSNHSLLFNINISLLAHNLKYLKKGYFLFSGNPDENIHVLTGLMVTQSLPSFLSPTCLKANLYKISIYSNKFFIIFTCPNPVLLVPGFGQVG